MILLPKRGLRSQGHQVLRLAARAGSDLGRAHHAIGIGVDRGIADARGRVALASVPEHGIENVAQVYRVEGADAGARPVALCDFASAGNTWSAASAYRVWLPLKR